MRHAPTSTILASDLERQSARIAGLRYVSDRAPGIRRHRAGRSFRYTSATGEPLREPEHLTRIRALAIPPAWTNVWICRDPMGHLQATGRDSKGRKQYKYHARWRDVRDEGKYGRLLEFGSALPVIRKKAARDLALPGMPKEKVVATIVELLERTLIRVGNEEYVRDNATFGLTTLRERHVSVYGRHLHFHFRGKSGKVHDIGVDDPRLAAIVKRCQELPGQELFHFRDDAGALHPIESADVNAYLREASGSDFTAKYFRTWHGTLLAASTLARGHRGARPTKRAVVLAVEEVARRLGNTPSVCRRSYVHPAIVARYLRGELLPIARPRRQATIDEAALMRILSTEAA